ncbi:MAG: aspartate dehydrogenase [Planktomarina sp.]|nr:aspartate dehydrogenase [Planktomarina sp.]|tara:strand:+ start:1704 stop:2507 length:804 start_codon:yes stop_codon:yes gene_type:complete
MKIGIAGTGAIGLMVAQYLDGGKIPGHVLVGLCARNDQRAAECNATLSRPVPHYAFSDIADHCDVVVECLPPKFFYDIAQAVLKAGKILVVMSASQLLGRDDLVELAAKNGGQIIVPSGAILGIDALKAAAVGELKSVTIKTCKPIAGLLNAPYLAKIGIDITVLEMPYCLLAGSVSEVAKEFPANVNVAAALSLAGMGPEQTKMEIWADPTLTQNQHTVSIQSDSSDFTVMIKNRPSAENPSTGKITAQSVIAWLRGLNGTMRIGT